LEGVLVSACVFFFIFRFLKQRNGSTSELELYVVSNVCGVSKGQAILTADNSGNKLAIKASSDPTEGAYSTPETLYSWWKGLFISPKNPNHPTP